MVEKGRGVRGSNEGWRQKGEGRWRGRDLLETSWVNRYSCALSHTFPYIHHLHDVRCHVTINISNIYLYLYSYLFLSLAGD